MRRVGGALIDERLLLSPAAAPTAAIVGGDLFVAGGSNGSLMHKRVFP